MEVCHTAESMQVINVIPARFLLSPQIRSWAAAAAGRSLRALWTARAPPEAPRAWKALVNITLTLGFPVSV